jgi:hypothetical protein
MGHPGVWRRLNRAPVPNEEGAGPGVGDPLELIDGIGFRGTRYQRSLPCHESDEYNFLNSHSVQRGTRVNTACQRPALN